MPISPGHVFCDSLENVLVAAKIDPLAGKIYAPYQVPKRGTMSVPPSRYLRTHVASDFKGIDSERGIEWRCADNLPLRTIVC